MKKRKQNVQKTVYNVKMEDASHVILVMKIMNNIMKAIEDF